MAFTNVYEFGTVFYSRAVALFSPAFCAIAGVSTEVSYGFEGCSNKSG
jgi:hypothetical protein